MLNYHDILERTSASPAQVVVGCGAPRGRREASDR
jgi:hypothetical protein